jgi:hypothetical protein
MMKCKQYCLVALEKFYISISYSALPSILFSVFNIPESQPSQSQGPVYIRRSLTQKPLNFALDSFIPFLLYSEKAAIITLCSARKLIFIMETLSVYDTACTHFLSIYYMINSTTRQPSDLITQFIPRTDHFLLHSLLQ